MPPLVTDAIFWVAVVCCLVAQVAILRSTFRANTESPEHVAGNLEMRPVNRSMEAVWAILPAVGLVVLFFFTWRALHPVIATPSDRPAASARAFAPASLPAATGAGFPVSRPLA